MGCIINVVELTTTKKCPSIASLHSRPYIENLCAAQHNSIELYCPTKAPLLVQTVKSWLKLHLSTPLTRPAHHSLCRWVSWHHGIKRRSRQRTPTVSLRTPIVFRTGLLCCPILVTLGNGMFLSLVITLSKLQLRGRSIHGTTRTKVRGALLATNWLILIVALRSLFATPHVLHSLFCEMLCKNVHVIRHSLRLTTLIVLWWFLIRWRMFPWLLLFNWVLSCF